MADGKRLPDPSKPFVIFIGSGRRRLGEVGHYIKRITSGAVGIVNIDPKRRGYSVTLMRMRFISLRHMTSASVVATSRASTLAAPGAAAPFTFQYPITVSWWHGAFRGGGFHYTRGRACVCVCAERRGT